MITSDSDILAAGASGSGSSIDPYVLENLTIISSGPCISVSNTSAYFIIKNCNIESFDFEPALILSNVENVQVVQCDITSDDSGITVFESANCSVYDTIIYDCRNGIHLYMTSNFTTTFSRIFDNRRGFLLESSSFCHIVNNSIYSNNGYGVDLRLYSTNNTIFGNSIGWNSGSYDIDGNVIDQGQYNLFDDGNSQGNAWSHFNGTSPYVIPGGSGSMDSYPQLLEDTDDPVLVTAADIAIDVESSGNILTWVASDEYPHAYGIQIDEGPQVYRTWKGGDIIEDLDSLQVGTYEYSLTLIDGSGNIVTDEVIVTVISFILGGIGTELVMIASGITVAIFVISFVLIKKLS
ncbi:MAG: right-handed parallel beta-helix repeat-containing protein [Candidatus Thorarchaeota archaeon]